MARNTHIERHHHMTLSVGGAQEDYDFHTKVLGLKNLKKTALYDGDVPVYHFYYGNDMGDESTLLTTFPMRQSGRKGRPGSGTVKTISLSVPVSSLEYWEKRLKEYGFSNNPSERFGERAIKFCHPCGIEYELVAIPDDDRKPYAGAGVPPEYAIRGTHGIVVSVRDMECSDEFMQEAWNGKQRRTDGDFIRYEVGKGGTGTIVDVELEPNVPQGSWGYGEGVVHHCAFQVKDLDTQSDVKFMLEGQGYTDVSDRKDRGYFDSIYIRTPGGPLFEAAVSKPQGFLIDEPYEEMGKTMQIPPVFVHRKDELLKSLEPIPVD